MCPISGGYWGDGSMAGVWALNLSAVRAGSSDGVGFRADSASPRISQENGGTKGGAFRRAVLLAAAKSVGCCISGRAIGFEGQAA